MQKLIDYLKQLNTAENQWGLWVNPGNYDEFRVGQYCFDNGGMPDGFVCVGSLDDLSYGFQSEREAFDSVAAELMEGHQFNADGLYEAWVNEKLAENLQSKFTDAIASVCESWAHEEATSFVYDLPEILAQEEIYA
ncbi:MAG: hypothetical protein ACP5D7_20050 [Limnospira sp.]